LDGSPHAAASNELKAAVAAIAVVALGNPKKLYTSSHDDIIQNEEQKQQSAVATASFHWRNSEII